jgi:hypothetical protein
MIVSSFIFYRPPKGSQVTWGSATLRRVEVLRAFWYAYVQPKHLIPGGCSLPLETFQSGGGIRPLVL